jgi:hypothetical protein
MVVRGSDTELNKWICPVVDDSGKWSEVFRFRKPILSFEEITKEDHEVRN